MQTARGRRHARGWHAGLGRRGGLQGSQGYGLHPSANHFVILREISGLRTFDMFSFLRIGAP